MMKLVECIPNFSVSRERDEPAFNALVDTAKAVPGCTVLDVQSDGTHNRCVFTLVGSPEGIGEAAFRLAKRAMEVIDMTKHQGAHPRMGATDVIPFVPTMDVTVEECVELLGGTGIYIDTAFSSGSVPPPWAKESIAAFGADHVLFGSDNPWSATGRELAFVRSLGLSEEETELILGKNAERLLGL